MIYKVQILRRVWSSKERLVEIIAGYTSAGVSFSIKHPSLLSRDMKDSCR